VISPAKIKSPIAYVPTSNEVRDSFCLRLDVSFIFYLNAVKLIFIYLQEDGEFTSKQAERRERLRRLQKSDQPYMVVIGTLSSIQNAYVCYDGEKIPVESLKHAVDICFKLFFVFDVQYPDESNHIWSFIQKRVYGINTKSDVYNRSVSSLLKRLTLTKP